MRTRMLALALGMLCLGGLPQLPPVAVLLFGCVLGGACLWLRFAHAGLFLLGFCWSCLFAQWALDDRLPAALDGRTLWLEGRVVGLPEQGERSVRFELESAVSRRAVLPGRLQLSWHGGPTVRSGEHWRLAVTLKRPSGLLNPHGPDREAILLARGIGAVGSVKAGERLAPAAMAWRDALRQRLLEVPAMGREGALTALVLGDGAALSRQDWQVLQATGTVHLMVISGQHIGLLAGLVYALIAGFARFGLWPRHLPWLPWACGLAFAAALLYGFLAGFQVPVRRACIMLAVVLLWRLRFRHLGASLPLLVALNGVLLTAPLASLLPGFWLSFGAVTVLIFCFSARLGAWSPWQAWQRAQWVIAIGLFPLLLALSLPVSFTAPLANLLAVPWISLVVLPLALAGTALLVVPPLGEGVLWLAGALLEGLFRCLALLGDWQQAWLAPAIPWWCWLLVMVGAFLVLLPRGIPLRPLGWPLLLLAGFAPQPGVPEGEVEVLHLDVGQGLAVLLRTREHALLYDAGPRQADNDLGERVVLPTLHRLGVRQLDRMLISHPDADHAGGALAVHRGLKVRQVVGGDADALPAPLQAEACRSGEHWEWNSVRFSLWQITGGNDPNQRSCVLQVEANGQRLLLAGDIDARAEAAWLRDHADPRLDWLQAPHHGSRTSSSEAFLRAARPRGVLVSRGRHNSFGHPHPQVLERYGALGIEVYDTALLGALRLRLGQSGRPEGQREQRRFWREPT